MYPNSWVWKSLHIVPLEPNQAGEEAQKESVKYEDSEENKSENTLREVNWIYIYIWYIGIHIHILSIGLYYKTRVQTTAGEWNSNTSDTNIRKKCQCPVKKKYLLATRREITKVQRKGNCTRFPETWYFACSAGRQGVLFDLEVCFWSDYITMPS